MKVSNFNESSSSLGFFASIRFEADAHDCEVEGEIPDDLRGTFYRVGVSRLYPSRYPDDAPFNGDGIVSMFRIADGHCDFRSRYVRTQRFLAERKARRSLFGRYRNISTSDPSVRELSHSTANTNIFHHAGRLLALKEDSRPVLLHPDTLATIDNDYDFDGELTARAFTAHPKIDPVTGEMIAFAYEAGGELSDDIAVYAFDRLGRKTWEAWLKAPVLSMMHDMAITQNHVILPTTPYLTSREQLEAGKVHWFYKTGEPVRVGVLRRGGDGRDVRWFVNRELCSMHIVNAYEEGSRIVVDFQASDSNVFPFIEMADGVPFDPERAHSTMRRWVIDLDANDDHIEDVRLFDNVNGGLPTGDTRYLTRPYRYGFTNEAVDTMPADLEAVGGMGGRRANCLARYDLASGRVDFGFGGDAHALGEPVFAPRTPDGPESDGFLLATANNFRTMRTELVIMDANRLEDGPLARVILPFRAPGQVHGNWIPAWDVPVDEVSSWL